MSAPTSVTEIHLASRPTGEPKLENFRVVETELPEVQPGQVVVRNLVMSVDPYMRGRMRDAKSYAEPFTVGAVMTGGAVGEVVESTVEDLPTGTTVLHDLGWRSHAVLDAARARPVDTDAAPVGAYLGILGMPGLTAYAGLFEVAEFTPGDTVFVSAAAGAVGSLVGQLAKLHGADRVIGSAGSPQKVRYLQEELGFDAAFDYHDGPVSKQLAAAAPHGVDVYFDNVGGEHLEAAIDAITVHGRIAVCGMISQYNATEPTPAPRNLPSIIGKRFTMRGFLVGDHTALQQQFRREIAPMVMAGKIRYRETVIEGLRNAPQAFCDLLAGANTGKMLVHIAD